jgi:hypothetical protein
VNFLKTLDRCYDLEIFKFGSKVDTMVETTGKTTSFKGLKSTIGRWVCKISARYKNFNQQYDPEIDGLEKNIDTME